MRLITENMYVSIFYTHRKKVRLGSLARIFASQPIRTRASSSKSKIFAFMKRRLAFLTAGIVTSTNRSF